MQKLQPPSSSNRALPPNAFPLRRTPGLLALHAAARNREASHAEFVTATRRIMRLLLEESLAYLCYEDRLVTTPTGFPFTGAALVQHELFAVSVPRAGDALEAELRDIHPGTRFGKVLIQRDTVTKLPRMFYQKLPAQIAGQQVLLLDPMMATAGTANMAVKVLQDAGVAEADILLVNVLTCPSALEKLYERHPMVRVVTSYIDDALTEQAFMRPGIGDFGDRFYGTTP
ncbi:uracil phosphoribosyltransferase [Pseudarthrobacter polychromogenes]|uniref:Uracil phosphoribosyltransferase n=1 Tax=Pseudarthrobacter polychromogenes TaxID=1676 RepID=A0ABQ1Y2S1_9MICC|nr:uracil phosphoribosyltransferase [Pseudarthrobacter polychromogenes]MBD1593880.1 uracil phosphoribosyltransferase [Arthrobacter sp. S1_S22]GGH09998.1 uracil phosphoribosyltransferase [Pseudarthrobacter polychromogenes]